MTIEETIKTLETAKAEVEWNYPLDYVVAIEQAIDVLKLHKNEEALKIPKGTIIEVSQDGKNWFKTRFALAFEEKIYCYSALPGFEGDLFTWKYTRLIKENENE